MVRELSTLRAEQAEQAGMHLVMTARLLDEDPDLALEHALAARRQGPRVGVIREAVGIASYRAGKWTEALAELRAARRISGGVEHWPMMADCERALGRPERTLAMAAAPEADQLDRAGRVEMRIVVAGARADMGQLAAAVVTLQTPDLNGPEAAQWVGRLRAAYAAALEAVGRDEEARTWWERAAASDPEGDTGAAERLAELDGVVFFDDDDEDDEHEPDAPDAASSVEPEMAAEPDVAVEPAAVVEPEAVEPQAVPEPVAELEPVAVSVAELEPVAVSVAEPEPALEMDTAPETETALEPESVLEPAEEASPPQPKVRPAVTAQLFLEPPISGPVDEDSEDDGDD